MRVQAALSVKLRLNPHSRADPRSLTRQHLGHSVREIGVSQESLSQIRDGTLSTRLDGTRLISLRISLKSSTESAHDFSAQILEPCVMRRILHSYDRPNITADDVSHARQIMDAHGGKNSASIEAALRTISTYDNSVRRPVILLLGQHLANARAREERERSRMWRPMF